VLLKVGAELLDRFFLVGAEVADQGHLGADLVAANVVFAVFHHESMVRDLDRGRIAVIELEARVWPPHVLKTMSRRAFLDLAKQLMPG
jgi:hypothetical protein